MTTVIVDAREIEQRTLEISADSFHHLFRVRRLRTGDLLRVVDGRGRARQGCVARIERHSAALELGESVPTNEADVAVELLVAAPRPQRAAWLVEKATEIGVAAIRFLSSERGPRSYGASTIGRLERTARAAVEQCDRTVLPQVTAMHGWDDVPALVDRLDWCFVLDPRARRERLELPVGAASVGLLIGPEGGWSERELEVFDSLSCKAVSLGPRILRVETAGLAGAAALLVTSSVDTL